MSYFKNKTEKLQLSGCEGRGKGSVFQNENGEYKLPNLFQKECLLQIKDLGRFYFFPACISSRSQL